MTFCNLLPSKVKEIIEPIEGFKGLIEMNNRVKQNNLGAYMNNMTQYLKLTDLLAGTSVESKNNIFKLTKMKVDEATKLGRVSKTIDGQFLNLSKKIAAGIDLKKEIEAGNITMDDISGYGAKIQLHLMDQYRKELDRLKELAKGIQEDNPEILMKYDTYYLDPYVEIQVREAIDKMGIIFDNEEDIRLFANHFSQGDYLRYLGKFNAKFAKELENKERFMKLMTKDGDVNLVSDDNFEFLKGVYGGTYNPVMNIFGLDAVKGFKAVRNIARDTGRFVKGFLNIPVASAMWLMSGMGYLAQHVSDVKGGEGVFDNKTLDGMLNDLGFTNDVVHNSYTRYAGEDVGNIFDGRLTYVDKMANAIGNMAKKYTKDTATAEALRESFKGWYNMQDVLWKKQMLRDSLYDALQKRGFTPASFQMGLGSSKNKELFIQVMREETEKMFENKVGFYFSGIDNLRKTDRTFSMFNFLGKRGETMMKNFRTHTVGNVFGLTIEGLVNKNPNWKKEVTEYILKDPRFSQARNNLFIASYLGHRFDNYVDYDHEEETTTQRVMHSLGFAKYFANSLQGIETNFLGRFFVNTIKDAVNPYGTGYRPEFMFANAMKQIGREFLRERDGLKIAGSVVTALAAGTIDKDFEEGLHAAYKAFVSARDGYQRFLVGDVLEGIGNTDPVPMGHNDRLSSIFLDQYNDYKLIMQDGFKFSNMAQFKEHTGDRMISVLSNVPIWDAIAKGVSLYKQDKNRDNYMILANKLKNDPIYKEAVANFTIPLTVSGTPMENMRWVSTVAYTLTSLDTLPSSDRAMLDIRKESLVRVGKDYNYKELIDLSLKNKMGADELAIAEKYFNTQDLKGSKAYLLMQMLEHDQPGLGSIVLGNMAKTYKEGLKQQLYGYKYEKLTPEQLYVVDQQVAATFGQWVGYVNFPAYQSLMHQYISRNPEYAEIKKNMDIDEDKDIYAFKGDMENLFASQLATQTLGLKRGDVSVAYIKTNLIYPLNMIKNEDLAMAGYNTAYDAISRIPSTQEQKVNMLIPLTNGAKKFIEKAAKDLKRYEEHKEGVDGLLNLYFGTSYQNTELEKIIGNKDAMADQIKAMISDDYKSSGSSGYKKSLSYYDKIRQYDSSPYVKDFILKNYNGYSNQSYGSRYPSAYRDRVRAVTSLDYRSLPGNVKSDRMIREFRSPDERGLPGGSFTKSSGVSKPYRVGEGTTTPKSKPKGF